jgi:pyruvate dehydrogenase E2 component (dihydrolipoamide acetyltransferase)
MSDFVMPSLGADMESAKVSEWLVKPGDAVKKGDVVAVVETHKGAIEVEIFQEGTIAELCAKEGDDVPVGGLLARLSGPGEAIAAKPAAAPAPAAEVPAPPKARPAEAKPEALPAPPAPAPAPPEVRPAAEARPEAPPTPPAPPPAPPLPSAAEGARAKVSPAARRRAAELGIDADALSGTGIDGSVTLADVELAAQTHAAPAPAARAPAAEEPAPPRKARGGFDPTEMRKAIAAAMSRSKREIPHYYLTSTIDLGNAITWLERYNEDKTPDLRLLPAVLLLKATALALSETPQLNGFWEEDAFRPGPGIHVGWAISLRGGGLVAPAIHDTDKKTLPELMAALRDIVGRARSGGLRSSELMDPTVTITSLGEQGADAVIGVIYPPQVAIIGFGRIAERPWIVGGRVKKRPLVSISLAADHRASDGHTGGMLLDAIDRLLQEPDKL